MTKHHLIKLSLAAVAGLSIASASHAVETLFSLSTTQGSDNTGTGLLDRYDSSAVTITTATNVSGPSVADLTSAGADGNGITGLTRFWNNAAGGWFSVETGQNDGTSPSNLNTRYFAVTISAAAGFTLDLNELTYKSGTFTADNVRGFEIYAEVNGGSFDSSDKIVDVNDENNTRPDGIARDADLSGAKFQGIESVTFRYYPLTDANGRTIEFGDFTVSGTVIPEPASLALLGLGGLCLLGGRRRRD